MQAFLDAIKNDAIDREGTNTATGVVVATPDTVNIPTETAGAVTGTPDGANALTVTATLAETLNAASTLTVTESPDDANIVTATLATTPVAATESSDGVMVLTVTETATETPDAAKTLTVTETAVGSSDGATTPTEAAGTATEAAAETLATVNCDATRNKHTQTDAVKIVERHTVVSVLYCVIAVICIFTVDHVYRLSMLAWRYASCT